ncbi:LytTR family DNA-binding domain-containing protein [Pseudoroseicyclus sp. CXY001]|uniref:LytTR family DNA-binding domain-containing protein n=1 Tax=Pseudoroseicyclus sp. CXY001 TaxID=3242492 RepID=UPI003570A00D
MKALVQDFLRPVRWQGPVGQGNVGQGSWVVWAAALLALSAVLGLTGPFGTWGLMELVPRLLFFKLAILAAVPLTWGITRLTATVGARLHPGVLAVLRALLFTAVFAPVMVGIYILFEPWLLAEAPGLFAVILKVLLVGLILHAVQWALRVSQPWIAAPPRLLARLPGHEGGRIWRLSADDHYVSVLIDGREEERLLLRFSDAVTEMDNVEGFLVHRSHWVAREAIREARREGSKEVVVLRNGARLPVSRTYRDELVALGLLPERGTGEAAEPQEAGWRSEGAPGSSAMALPRGRGAP